jgi:hypothetical protein
LRSNQPYSPVPLVPTPQIEAELTGEFAMSSVKFWMYGYKFRIDATAFVELQQQDQLHR